MNTLQRLLHWRETDAITEAQYRTISKIIRKDRFSIFFELNALLYLGVLSFIAGVGWVIQTYVATLGDTAILSSLTVMLAASFYHCFSRGRPFAPGRVEFPSLSFDYVLYLGCLTFAIEIGYIESRFHLLQNDWDYYLLVTAAIFFGLAYRFDNRFVLSLALSTFAGWFGLRISRLDFSSGEALRRSALIYSMVVIGAGTWLYRRNIKKHFTETYFHVAAMVLFSALTSGVFESNSWLYLFGVLCLAAIAIVGGIRFGRFAFVVYAIAFSYVAVSCQVLNGVRIDSTFALGYLVLSGLLVIFATIALARRFGRTE